MATEKSFGYLLIVLFSSKVLLEFTKIKYKNWDIFLINILILIGIFIIILMRFNGNIFDNYASIPFLLSNKSIIFCSFLIIITEVYHLSDFFNKLNLSPSIIFAISFLLIIAIGSGLLMLPNATIQPLSFLEALFTSVSAVCVTGLIVVDTATVFTP
ncbi:MAG: hypothetical protein HC905_15535 [Bacteroidales bacterium]|nr:hypothetical protein [Bacteroidales bacterium]